MRGKIVYNSKMLCCHFARIRVADFKFARRRFVVLSILVLSPKHMHSNTTFNIQITSILPAPTVHVGVVTGLGFQLNITNVAFFVDDNFP